MIHDLNAAGIGLQFDPGCGLIAGFTVTDNGRQMTPLHRAPWIGEVLPADTPPHLTRLGGDFFCAPFADATADDGAALHGWPANSQWDVRNSGAQLQAVLQRKVFGAVLTKDIILHDDHPFVYQRHTFDGGSAALAVANHAMVALPQGGHLRFSPKAGFETPDTAPEPDASRGRSALAYPARVQNPAQFPAAGGGLIDIRRYPFGPAHEDFVIAVERPGHTFGWTAVTRTGMGDLYLSLRNAAQLPMTMLWHSNGGRDYAPWSGRHLGCLGVEEGVALPMLGAASRAAWPETGQPGLLQLGGSVDVHHVIGAIDWPSGQAVAAVDIVPGGLRITGESGAVRDVPFDAAFLALG